MFQFATLHLEDLVICLVAGLGSILWFEALKLMNGRRAAMEQNGSN